MTSRRPLVIAAWVAVGCAYVFAALAILTIGIFVLPVALLATAVLLLRHGADRAVAGALVAGEGLPLLYLAWLNRQGPGTICRTSDGNLACGDQISPWPWLVAGLVLAAIGGWLIRASMKPPAPAH